MDQFKGCATGGGGGAVCVALPGRVRRWTNRVADAQDNGKRQPSRGRGTGDGECFKVLDIAIWNATPTSDANRA
jgi:hypothetical protein